MKAIHKEGKILTLPSLLSILLLKPFHPSLWDLTIKPKALTLMMQVQTSQSHKINLPMHLKVKKFVLAMSKMFTLQMRLLINLRAKPLPLLKFTKVVPK